MPTIIVLDVSLSMTRLIPCQVEEQVTYHQLAVQGINQFLDYLASTSKLEYVSLDVSMGLRPTVLKLAKAASHHLAFGRPTLCFAFRFGCLYFFRDTTLINMLHMTETTSSVYNSLHPRIGNGSFDFWEPDCLGSQKSNEPLPILM